MKLEAKSRLIARESDVKQQVIDASNELIAQLMPRALKLDVSKSQVIQYIGDFVNEEVLPGVDNGAYDLHHALAVLHSITVFQIAHHFNISGDKTSPAEIQDQAHHLMAQPGARAQILKKLGLNPAEFHALVMMIGQDLKHGAH